MAGEAVLSFAVEAVLSKLVSTVAQEVNLAWGLKGGIKTLGGKLNIILNLLKDAERQQQKGASMESWLLRLKNAAYDAEDVLDVFAFEMLRRKLEIQNRMKNKARNFFSLSNPILFRIKMAHKVKDVNLMLAGVVKEGKDLGLNQALHQVLPRIPRDFLPTHPYQDDSNILGREADTSKVVHTLLQSRSDENLSVVSVVGLAGLGKTSLARLVYKDQSVTTHFNHTMWVCVSDDFNPTRILKEMASYLRLNVGEISSTGVLTEKLKEKLQGSKFLLVLDDVWNEDVEKWENLRGSLIGISAIKESKVLVTTRSVTVASTMESLITHNLSVLSDEDSWAVFHQKAFAIGGPNETPFLVDVGQRMIKKCGGVPLALKSLGAMMYSKKDHEWPSIERSSLWNDKKGIMPALRLSFNNLPLPCLKQCFAYCSIFPKDFEFDKDDLIQLWIAQGFIPQSERSNSAMEDTGNEYFKILWWNSFFQDVEMDKYGKIKTCKMHDLVHDLALSLAKSECLVLDANNSMNNIEVRHLALAENVGIVTIIPEENAMKLRTLFSLGARGGGILLNSKFLHALKLEEDIEELPTTIGKLKQLRYLDVSETYIKVFPAFIAKLYNLQTLRLTCLDESVELLEQLNALIRLRHLYFESDGTPLMPIALGRLTCLQTLSCFVVGKDKGRHIEELGPLSNLRGKLDIRELQYVSSKEEAKKANLMGKTMVYKLKLAWSGEREGDNNDEDVLEGLQPPPNLKSLTIEKFYGSNFPSSWNGNPPLPQSLVKISLFGCEKCERIPTLGELPFLKHLEIRGMLNVKCMGMEFYSYSNIDGDKRRAYFPALQKLFLQGMSSLVEWTEVAATTTEGAVAVFPCLEKLYIDECEQLLIAPSHFPYLRELKIDCVKSGVPITSIISKVSTLTHLTIENVSSELELLLQNNRNLIYVEISDCEMLRCISIGSSLQELSITGCGGITSLPTGLFGASLQELSIRSCGGITSLPTGLFGSCTSLQKLKVCDCPNLISIAPEVEEEEDLSKLNSPLSGLEITGCPKLKSWALDRFLHCFPMLKRLSIEGCGGITSLPTGLGSSLQNLTIIGCNGITSLPTGLGSSLQKLSIWRCDGITSLPTGLFGSGTSLQKLKVSRCPNLISIAPEVEEEEDLSKLNSPLSSLVICRCPKLKSWSLDRFLHCFPMLKRLVIGGFSEELDSFPLDINIIRQLPQIEDLTLIGWPKLKSLPHQLQHFTTLKELYIYDFEGLEVLPDWLGNLSSLYRLAIWDCCNLKYLPSVESMGRLTNLRTFRVDDCPLLDERCSEEGSGGPEWSKICHIPEIWINGRIIQ